MEKINLVELLKVCPEGMELDCTMYNKVTLVNVDNKEDNPYPIKIKLETGCCIILTKYGQYTDADFAKCVIYPKGKTTWEGFVPPCQFKDGDIISNGNYIAIFHKIGTPCGCTSSSVVYYHCYYSQKYCNFKKELDFGIGIFTEFKYATEEERQKLFNVIKANGYNWNEESKTLEKLVKPRFKVGDKIKRNGDIRLTTIKDIRDNYYIITIQDFFDNAYITDKLLFSNQNEYELVPNKFGITTLVPFESKVLVRNVDGGSWKPAIYGFSPSNGGCYVVGGIYWKQCIPYEGNQHLRGKTNDCDDYYKNWE